jgi:hypothetical protein
MSSPDPNPSADQENAKDTQQTLDDIQESVLKDAVDPRDLVMKGRSVLDPNEIGSNPALAPETVALNDPAEVKEGYKSDRD